MDAYTSGYNVDSALEDYLKRFGNDKITEFKRSNPTQVMTQTAPTKGIDAFTSALPKVDVASTGQDIQNKVNIAGENLPSKSGFMDKLGGAGTLTSLASSLGGALTDPQKSAELDEHLGIDPNIRQGYESIKDSVAQLHPIAGAAVAVQKLGKGLGQSLGGDTGGALAAGALDPLTNIMSKETTGAEKLLSVAGGPVASAIIANKAMKRSKNEASEKLRKENLITDYKERNKAEQKATLEGKQNELEGLKKLHAMQLGIIS